jgi:hypothetical protein
MAETIETKYEFNGVETDYLPSGLEDDILLQLKAEDLYVPPPYRPIKYRYSNQSQIQFKFILSDIYDLNVSSLNPVPIQGQINASLTSGSASIFFTNPPECSPCANLFYTYGDWRPVGGSESTGAGPMFIGTCTYMEEYSLDWLSIPDHVYSLPDDIYPIFSESRTVDVEDYYVRKTESKTREVTGSGNCVCCCCACSKVLPSGMGDSPTTDADCSSAYGSGWIATSTAFSAGALCSGSLTWAQDSTCYGCIYQ